MNWFAGIMRKLVDGIKKYIREQQNLKAEFKFIENQAYANEMQEVAAEIGRQKAKGTYKSPLMKFIMRKTKPQKFMASDIKNPKDLF